VTVVERHHDAADAFDQQVARMPFDGALGEFDELGERQGPVLALAGQVGRQRRRVSPRRDAVELGGIDRPA
jgi:hypothetical protein